MFEGKRAMTADNNTLSKFELTGIPPVPRVSFKLKSHSTSMQMVYSMYLLKIEALEKIGPTNYRNGPKWNER